MALAPKSKDQLLYEQVKDGNIMGIRTLRNKGAGLEWVDKDGKTPLILACSRSDLRDAAKVLIELGANVNAYRPGRYSGTPLHHAARKGLERTVRLLLSHGANPFIVNNNCLMPLDLAREKGHVQIVRDIEGQICIFCGWLREDYRPGFPEVLARLFFLRKVWAVVLPVKFELAIYTDVTAAEPTKVIHLWKCKLEEPIFNQVDPALIFHEISTRTKHKFLSEDEGDKIQLQAFFNAWRGLIAQVMMVMPTPGVAPVHNQVNVPNPSMPAITAGPAVQAKISRSPNQEDMQLAMVINASIQSAIIGVSDMFPFIMVAQPLASFGTNGWATRSSMPSTLNWWGPPSSGTNTNEDNSSTVLDWWASPDTLQVQTSVLTQSALSAPPINASLYAGPMQYPSIDSNPIHISTATGALNNTTLGAGTGSSDKKEGTGTCVICLDALVEGACIPCGHMAGCMGCLRRIKKKRGKCPICRAKIKQVLKLYVV
ncbi:RING/U-box superfamily protein [Rhynchospora pubera]|uniref:RING/U-box superfamily protein n=1 Tax=Rhynchospora pubera TaxID=906938 RepID=A0AAV8GL38_9POAL|nr:RING/U-box superfamily protein [Rhynchospora pubera]